MFLLLYQGQLVLSACMVFFISSASTCKDFFRTLLFTASSVLCNSLLLFEQLICQMCPQHFFYFAAFSIADISVSWFFIWLFLNTQLIVF